jgi:hypothetical protein
MGTKRRARSVASFDEPTTAIYRGDSALDFVITVDNGTNPIGGIAIQPAL